MNENKEEKQRRKYNGPPISRIKTNEDKEEKQRRKYNVSTNFTNENE
jgi:hypothetical protein